LIEKDKKTKKPENIGPVPDGSLTGRRNHFSGVVLCIKGLKDMDKSSMSRVLDHPEFKKMEQEKNRMRWFFSFLVFAVYVTYITYIGMNPDFFGRPLFEGSVVTIGIYAGIFIIVFSVVLTGVYVRKANRKFDEVTKKVIFEIEGGHHA